MGNPRYSIFSARAVFDERLTPTEVRVLAALGTYADDEGWCFPNQTTLATRLAVTRQTVSGAIKNLVACGYVQTEIRTAKGRGKVGYNYRVVLDLKRCDATKKAEAKLADIGTGRQRQDPTSAPADFGADSDPLSAQASIATKDITNPSERTQHALTSFELEPSTEEKPLKAKKRATHIDPHWVPDVQTREYASALGFLTWEIEAASVEFREYWQERIDKQSAKVDWNLTFKRRLRDLAADSKQRNKLKLVQPAINGHALITKDQWTLGLQMWRDGRKWIRELGPRPDQSGYRGPAL